MRVKQGGTDMTKRLILLIGGIFGLLNIAQAQWECRSHLGANMKPFVEDGKLLWAGEVQASAGSLTDHFIATGMLFGGLDYSLGKHQFYFEGGAKYWLNKDLDLNYDFTRTRLGIREAYYAFQSEKDQLKLGFQTMQMDDYFLLNERTYGFSYRKQYSGLKLNLSLGSVTRDFSRNGIFCTNNYLYDILPNRTFPIPGTEFGKTNFAGLTAIWSPGEKHTQSASSSDDEFSSEGFSDLEQTSSKQNNIRISQLGLVAYSQFGSGYDNASVFGGGLLNLALPADFSWKTEVLYQASQSNNALLYYSSLSKSWSMGINSRTEFNAAWLGMSHLSNNAVPQISFSNLMLGEVSRLDIFDLPLAHLSLKHSFTKSQLSFKLQYARKLKDDKIEELNFSAGKFFLNKHLRTTAILGQVKANTLDKSYHLAKLELRYFF